MSAHRGGSPTALAIIALAAVLVATAFTIEAASPPATVHAVDPGIHSRAHRAPWPSHEVYGYLPYWQVAAGTAGRLDYGHVTTIAFFAVPIGPTGALVRSSAGYRAYVSSAARAVINAAHSRGVRVVPTFQLFDHGSLSKLRHLLASHSAQTRFINQALTLMVRRRADGANLDIEPLPKSLASQVGTFVGRFARAMHARIRGSQLVVAVPAIASDRMLRAVSGGADRLFVMAYDYHWRGSRRPGPVAPLHYGRHNVDRTISSYLRVVPRHKLILGVPYYGYSWPVYRSGSTYRVRSNPGHYGGVRAVSYASAVEWLAKHPSVAVHRDPVGGSWFRYWNSAENTARQVHFEDSGSARLKFNYAIAHGLAGVGIWTLDNDQGHGGMEKAIQATFVSPVRRALVGATARHVRLDHGVVRLPTSVTIRGLGTRAERGFVKWRMIGPNGQTVATGRRLTSVYPGGLVRLAITMNVGRATTRAAGVYRLQVSFVAFHRTWRAPTVRFRQPW